MSLLKGLLVLVMLGALGAAAFVYFGVFNAAADVPHWPLVHELLETVRQRSIAVRARGIAVPLLDDPALIADGAQHYAEMCTGCHLAPGVTDSEIRPGLYPQPPDLTRPLDASAAEMFWAIKHGIKMSAMPAWGATHDDHAIWAIVAFLQKLPGLTPQQYQALVHGPDKGGHGQHPHDDMTRAVGDDDAAIDAGPHPHPHQHQHGAGGEAGEPGKAASAAAQAPISLEGLKPRAAAEAEAVAAAFHRALQAGDRAGALALLSADVTVTESGHTQSRSEYASGHLGEDIAFLKSVDVELLSLASLPTGDAALVGSESALHKKDSSKVLRSRELLTLRRENGTWKIVAIRWE